MRRQNLLSRKDFAKHVSASTMFVDLSPQHQEEEGKTEFKSTFEQLKAMRSEAKEL